MTMGPGLSVFVACNVMRLGLLPVWCPFSLHNILYIRVRYRCAIAVCRLGNRFLESHPAAECQIWPLVSLSLISSSSTTCDALTRPDAIHHVNNVTRSSCSTLHSRLRQAHAPLSQHSRSSVSRFSKTFKQLGKLRIHRLW